jgi:putative DNA primase/helicase
MLDVALDYARRGWPVFPCNPAPSGTSSKQPLVARDRDPDGVPVPRTGGLYKATTDLAQIRAWWTAWPKALIGVRMGREAGVFAIDPDVPKKPEDPDGLAAWYALLEKHGGMPPTHMHESPSGGLHILFRWRADRPVTNREGDLPPGINVRGEGGYIIVPPSSLSDGRTYRLVDPSTFFCFAEAPGWLYDLILPAPSKVHGRTAPTPDQGFGFENRGSGQAYGGAALERECEAVAGAPPGRRNNLLNRAAFSLGTLAGAGLLDADLIRGRLFEAAAACGLVQDDGRTAVLNTIESGLTAGLDHPREVPVLGHPTRAQPRARPADETVSQRSDATQGIITQDDLARRFAERYAGRLRFCHHTGAWFQWTGTHWRKDETDLAFQFARVLGREASDAAGLTAKEVKEVRKVTFASGVERFARGDPAFAVTADSWDADPFLLGTPAGTVDLRTGSIRAPDPRDGITKLTSVAPADEAACPIWLGFLDEATGGDPGLVRFLQQWCGYSLTGDTREHALVFVYGSGGNGKTVFLNTTSRIASGYATNAPMDTFAASKTDRHPTDLAMLRGARMVTASETEEGRAWAESRIKQMTGGDPVTARFMRQDFFTYQPQFKLTIVGNHKPVLRNVDEAARRRFNLVPFTRKPAQPDRQLETKLQHEWPAILRWMIEGCLDWQANGLLQPDAVKAATAEYFDNQDLFGQWLEDECDVEAGNDYKWETTATLFTSWSEYAQRAGESPGSKRSFSEAMQRRGFEPSKGSKGVRIFRGVRKRPDQDGDWVAGGG